jgi:hypothetical protein
VDLDPVRGEVLARAIGGEHLDIEASEVTRKDGDPVSVRHGEQGTQPGVPPDATVKGPIRGRGGRT